MKNPVFRRCVACGALAPQRALLRVAAREGSTPQLDSSGKALGRGAYLCPNPTCLQRAWKKRAFERALKLKNPPAAQLRAELEAAIRARHGLRTAKHEPS